MLTAKEIRQKLGVSGQGSAGRSGLPLLSPTETLPALRLLLLLLFPHLKGREGKEEMWEQSSD